MLFTELTLNLAESSHERVAKRNQSNTDST